MGLNDAFNGAMINIEPVAPTNTHETIQARLMRFISDHKLVGGDRLPSQANLAQALGVSLVSLREAMRALEAVGIIEARAGSGWYVRDFSFDAVAKGLAYTFELNQYNFADLLEIRIRLECSYLPEAMRKLTPDDLEALEDSVCEMEKLAASGQEFDAPDRAFHMRLFTTKVQNQLFTAILELFWALYPHLPAPPGRAQRAPLMADAHRHRLILEAVREGNAELAVQRLRDTVQGAVRRASEASGP
jgi:DNA-binding FadR family transcriptional regulator